MFWSAKRVRLEPACSKPTQKRVAKTKSTMMAPMRFVSTGVVPPVRSSHAKSTTVATRITLSRQAQK